MRIERGDGKSRGLEVSADDHGIVKGIYEPWEGLRDFQTFEEYFTKWVMPNLLGDLETVLEGARQWWELRKQPPGAPGRGDFFLATVLMSVFDHLGAFLVESDAHWITAAENIARISRNLDSTFDVYCVLANLGRNALIHGAWPQTSIPMPASAASVERWAFGLSFNANSDRARHDTLHTKLEVNGANAVLKLVLNVHNLRRELLDWIESGLLLRNVTARAFERVRAGATIMGDPRKVEELNDTYTPGWRRRIDRRARPKVFAPKDFARQIENLLIEAKEIGAWRSNTDYKRRRTHRGHRAPWRK
jgi:hypothetical protein